MIFLQFYNDYRYKLIAQQEKKIKKYTCRKFEVLHFFNGIWHLYTFEGVLDFDRFAAIGPEERNVHHRRAWVREIALRMDKNHWWWR